MQLKSILKSVIQKSIFARKLKLRMSNKLYLGGCIFNNDNVHFQNNTVNMRLGKGQIFSCASSSFMQYCVLNLFGDGNSVIIGDNTEIYGEGRQNFHIDGTDNQIVIGNNCSIRNTTFFVKGNHNRIILEDKVSCYGAEFHIEQDNNEIIVGSGSTFHGRNGYPIHMAADEGSRIIIKEDCMLSNGIQIRSTDSHSIIDKNRKRLNPAEDIVIGNHCWIGLGCIILKGTHIAPHTVVAAGSVCTKKYKEENCVLAGNPAKVVKQSVDWDRKFI